MAAPSLDGRPEEKSKGRSSARNLFPVLPADFGRYRVLRLLGRGGMGAVYLAHDSHLDREVALKIPFFDAGESPERAERFVREARSAAALHHPNICTVFDAGQVGDRAFITMAYIAGAPLDAEFEPDSPLPQERAAAVARTVALALEHAHGKGIVHRDLKPANVMIDERGEPVVMDFGLAKRVSETDPDVGPPPGGADPHGPKLTRVGGLLGTPGYMSPEQVRGDLSAVGPATDVYALGAMLFEMLTGRTPYTGPLSVVIGQILTAPVPPVREFRPDADPRLEAICATALAKDPADRFPGMAALAQALDEFLTPAERPEMVSVVLAPPAVPAASPFDQLDDPPAPSPAPPPAPRKAWKRRVAGAAAAAGLALGAWLAIAVLRREPATVPVAAEVGDPKRVPAAPKAVAKKEPGPPAAPVFAPENSEWAGAAQGRGVNEEVYRFCGSWTFTERRGQAFKALWRTIGERKAMFEGTIGATGRITLRTREQLQPEAGPRTEIKGDGEVGTDRMWLLVEAPDGATARLELKRLPDAGVGFNFPGRWQCFHRPSGWNGWRTVTADTVTTDRFPGVEGWERDGGLITVRYPGDGREWLVIDPDNPNELTGVGGEQSVTWLRR